VRNLTADSACHATRAPAAPPPAGYTGGWLSRFPLLFVTVRWPLHAAISAASFTITLAAGARGALTLRMLCAVVDACVIAAFERSSRAHFAARRAAAAARKAADTKAHAAGLKLE
jgi:hypothetical protein